MVMMVKDEEDVIEHNLEWLYFIGVRRYVIADNQSSDTTPDKIAAFSSSRLDAKVFLIKDPLVSYTQSLKTTGMIRFAISIWPDLQWVFPVDADEFLVPSKGLESLNAIPEHVEALAIPKVIHMRQSHCEQADLDSPLRLMGLRNPPFCVPPKSACRAHLSLSVSGGNHLILKSDGSSPIYNGAFEFGIYYREFQTRSFEHFLKKVMNGGPAILAARSEGRGEGGDHWLQWYKTLQEEGEDVLRAQYQRDYVRDHDAHFVPDLFVGVT